MVESALHNPVEVLLFLLLCSDFLIVSGREVAFLFTQKEGRDSIR